MINKYDMFTFLKVILSGEIMIEVLVVREIDLVEGKETAAVTAAMFF